jgi:protein-serine/threonine kinase
MLCMCANGCLWDKAVAGSSPLYDALVNGWAEWNTKHGGDPEITESDYPHVSFFDSHIKPPALRRLLLAMLNPDPTKRVTMTGVANNRWLKHVECCQVDNYEDPSHPTAHIDASRPGTCTTKTARVIHHNHLPPHTHVGHKLVRLPGSNELC